MNGNYARLCVLLMLCVMGQAFAAAPAPIPAPEPGTPVEYHAGTRSFEGTFQQKVSDQFWAVRSSTGLRMVVRASDVRVLGVPAAKAAATSAPTTEPCIASGREFRVGAVVEYTNTLWNRGTARRIVGDWMMVQDTAYKDYHWVSRYYVRLAGAEFEISGGGDKLERVAADSSPPATPAGKAASNRISGDQFLTAGSLKDPFAKADAKELAAADVKLPPLPSWATGPSGFLGNIKITKHANLEQNAQRFFAAVDNPNIVVISSKAFSFDSVQLLRVSLNAHNQLDANTLAAKDPLLDVAESGQLVIARYNFQKTAERCIQFQRYSGGQYYVVDYMQPFAGKLLLARFLANDRLLVAGAEGHVYVVDLNKRAALFHTATMPGMPVDMHQARHLLAVIRPDGQLQVIDTAAWAQVAHFSLQKLPDKCRISISSDGRFVAFMTPEEVRLFDIVGNRRVLTSALWTGALEGKGFLLDDRYVLLDDGSLYDLVNGTSVWTYVFGGSVSRLLPPSVGVLAGGRAYCFQLDQTPGTYNFCGARIPHDAVLEAQDTDIAGATLLKAGMKVSLSLQLASVTPEEKTAIETTLKKMIVDAGYVLADKQPFCVQATITSEGKKRAKCNIHGGFDDPVRVEDITWEPMDMTLSIKKEGTVVWSDHNRLDPIASHTGIYAFTVEPGKSAQASVDRLYSDKAAYFRGMSLPKRLMQTSAGTSGSTLGLTAIGPDGMQDGKSVRK